MQIKDLYDTAKRGHGGQDEFNLWAVTTLLINVDKELEITRDSEIKILADGKELNLKNFFKRIRENMHHEILSRAKTMAKNKVKELGERIFLTDFEEEEWDDYE